MAKILPFPPLDATRSRKADDVPAEIVFFPGIRVEYHDRPPGPTGNGRPRGRGGRTSRKSAVNA